MTAARRGTKILRRAVFQVNSDRVHKSSLITFYLDVGQAGIWLQFHFRPEKNTYESLFIAKKDQTSINLLPSFTCYYIIQCSLVAAKQ